MHYPLLASKKPTTATRKNVLNQWVTHSLFHSGKVGFPLLPTTPEWVSHCARVYFPPIRGVFTSHSVRQREKARSLVREPSEGPRMISHFRPNDVTRRILLNVFWLTAANPCLSFTHYRLYLFHVHSLAPSAICLLLPALVFASSQHPAR